MNKGGISKQRYWDANVFLGWFNNEPDKINKCRGIIKLAVKGDLIIATSAITLIEVIKLKGKPSLKPEQESKIKEFFEQEYISIRIVDRALAEQARQLIWKFKVQPKDAIHLATAQKLKIKIVDTFDEELIELNNKIGNPPLRIGYPDISYQESFDFEEET